MFFFGGVFWAVSQPWWTVDLSMLASSAPLLGALGAYSVPAWAGVVWIVMLGTLAPYALNLAALRRMSPTAVGVIGMSEPVGAGLVAWAWLGQALTTIQVAGGLIVLFRHRSRPTRRCTRARRTHDGCPDARQDGTGGG